MSEAQRAAGWCKADFGPHELTHERQPNVYQVGLAVACVKGLSGLCLFRYWHSQIEWYRGDPFASIQVKGFFITTVRRKCDVGKDLYF